MDHYHHAQSLFILTQAETIEPHYRGQTHSSTGLPSSRSRHEYGIRNANHVASTVRHLNKESDHEAMTKNFDVVRSGNSVSVLTLACFGKRDTRSCNISTDFTSPVPLPRRHFVLPTRSKCGPLHLRRHHDVDHSGNHLLNCGPLYSGVAVATYRRINSYIGYHW
jgi:hypothetical protein